MRRGGLDRRRTVTLQAMTELGPCVICGATDYNLSMGGPTICPSCDCGDFGMAKVQRLATEIAQLRRRITTLEGMLGEMNIEVPEWKP